MTAESYRERSNRRRDERQAKVDVRPPRRSKGKDTRRWCRGKRGVEHKPVCVDYDKHKRVDFRVPTGWKLLLCSECGKELAHWFPVAWQRSKIKPPDWVKHG